MTAHRISLAVAALAAVALTAAVAGAQKAPVAQHTSARWQAWYGCWSAVPHDSAMVPTSPRVVCLTPTSSADVVEVVALANGNVVHRDTVDASARPQLIQENGCTGSQSAQWSDDGRRVFLKALTTCGGAVTRTTAILTMTPFGEWLDIRSVESAGNTAVNVARYRDIGFNSEIPSDIIDAVRGYGPNVDAARLASGAPIQASAVIEASKIVNSGVLEAWVTQTGLDFVTDASSLQQLADAGVPGKVTDAMVTVDANSRDVYDRWTGTPYGRQASDYWDQGTGQRVVFTEWSNDPWGFGSGAWRYGHEYSRYAFGTSDWSWLYGPAWGFSSAFGRVGYTDSNVGSMLPPTIVLHNDPSNTAARGRAEKADNADPPKASTDGILSKAIDAMTGGKSSTSSPRTTSGKPSPR